MRAPLAQWLSGGRHLPYNGGSVFLKHGGSGPKLLLVHGTPIGAFDWHLAWPHLCDCFSVMAPDLPGMGLSAGFEFDNTGSVVRWAAFLEHLVATEGWTNFFVVAHGLGVPVVQELLARDNLARLPRIGGAVFLNGLLFPDEWRPLFRERLWQTRVAGLLRLTMRKASFGRGVADLFGTVSPATGDMVDDLYDLAGANGLQRYTHQTTVEATASLSRNKLRVASMLNSKIPLRFVSGEADKRLGQRMSQRYRLVSPNADVVRLAEVGHWPQLEVPRLVVGYIAQKLLYIRRRGASSAPVTR